MLPLINDSDPNGKIVPSTLTIVTPPKHGSLIINGTTGTVIYLPEEDYLGEDSFVYSICDDGTVLWGDVRYRNRQNYRTDGKRRSGGCQ
jgi:hypothetical protein